MAFETLYNIFFPDLINLFCVLLSFPEQYALATQQPKLIFSVYPVHPLQIFPSILTDASLFTNLIFWSTWIFGINFDFKKYCTKYLLLD